MRLQKYVAGPPTTVKLSNMGAQSPDRCWARIYDGGPTFREQIPTIGLVNYLHKYQSITNTIRTER